jgi:hypothetical protein
MNQFLGDGMRRIFKTVSIMDSGPTASAFSLWLKEIRSLNPPKWGWSQQSMTNNRSMAQGGSIGNITSTIRPEIHE